jgi:hypothetical protein
VRAPPWRTLIQCLSARQAFADSSRGIFDPVARHLREDLREDRLAEGIGLTFEMYKRYAECGVIDNGASSRTLRPIATDGNVFST